MTRFIKQQITSLTNQFSTFHFSFRDMKYMFLFSPLWSGPEMVVLRVRKSLVCWVLVRQKQRKPSRFLVSVLSLCSVSIVRNCLSVRFEKKKNFGLFGFKNVKGFTSVVFSSVPRSPKQNLHLR